MEDLFRNIEENEKIKLLRLLEANTVTFKENVNIFKYIKEKKVIGVIESGCIEVIRNNPNGSRTIMEELQEKDIFGYLISVSPSEECEFITKEETKIIVLEYNSVMASNRACGASYDQLLRNLVGLVTNKIKEKNERIEVLTKKTIRDKLLEYFRIISSNSCSKHVYLPFSYTELAEYLAVDRSAMSRELKSLKDEGFITVKGKKITLLY